jgi:hypothetical protein
MTAIAYGMTDMAPSPDGHVAAGTVSVPVGAGGCGRQHTAQLDENHRPFIACDQCVPVLVGGPHPAWASTPNGVPLTPDEIAERELAERDGTAMQRVMMKSVTDHFIESMAAKGAAAATKPAATAAELFRALSPAERAEFAAMLTTATGDGEAPAVKAPVKAPAAKRPAAAAKAEVKPPAGKAS